MIDRCDIARIDESARAAIETDPRKWMSPAEYECWHATQSTASRKQWLAGRWLAKRLICDWLGDESIAAHELHIESRNGRGQKSKPLVFIRGKLVDVALTLSHSTRTIAVACADGKTRLGIDLVSAQPLSETFTKTWFQESERALPLSGELNSLIWSAKEAWYKAENNGETFRPRHWDTTRLVQPRDWRVIDSELRARGFFETVSSCGSRRLVVHQLQDEFCTIVSHRPVQDQAYTHEDAKLSCVGNC